MTWKWGSVWPIWLLAAVGAIVIAATNAPGGGILWLPIVLGLCTLAAFGVQLAGPTLPGLVDRMSFSIFGAIVVLAIATGIMVPLSLIE